EEYVQDDAEEIDDELVHDDEQVNDDEDEEMTNAKDADTGTVMMKLLMQQRSTLCYYSKTIYPREIDVHELKESGRCALKGAQKHTKEPIQKYPQQIDYKEIIEESVQTNLVNKIDKSHSYLTHDKHQVLFDTLFNSLSLNEAIARGEADLEKVLRKIDCDDEDPSAGPNQGKKTKRSRTKESEPSKKSSTSKESSKGKSPAKTSKSGKSVTIKEPVEETVFEMAFDDIKQTVNDVENDANQLPDDST
nr:hypothetical protein [Tanacetum cinerariifolium]